MLKKLTNNSFINNVGFIFFTTIGEKFFGLLRELLIAYYFGASVEYAQYLFLSIVIDLMMVAGGENVMQVNLVPRFTRIIKNYGYLNKTQIKITAFKVGGYLALLSLVVINAKVGITAVFTSQNIVLSILLSLTLGSYFFNSIGLITQIADGNYKNYAKASIVFSFFSALLIIPFAYFFGIVGLALSRLVSISLQYFWLWKLNDSDSAVRAPLSEENIFAHDFSPSTILTSNVYVLILMVCKLLYATNSNVGITHYGYATFIMGIIITTIVKSLSTVLLRKLALQFDGETIKRIIVFLVIICAIYCAGIYYFGQYFIKLLFMRGKFTAQDVSYTYQITNLLSLATFFQACLIIFNQPIMASTTSIKQHYSLVSSILFVAISVVFWCLAKFSTLSIVSLIVAYTYISSIVLLISSFYYLRQLAKNNS